MGAGLESMVVAAPGCGDGPEAARSAFPRHYAHARVGYGSNRQGAKGGGVLYVSPMPLFGSILNDVDIADIIDYERSSWGNHANS
jgi:mono/diheme cytochrome c family protein